MSMRARRADPPGNNDSSHGNVKRHSAGGSAAEQRGPASGDVLQFIPLG